MLVCALAAQVKLELGDADRNIEEMVDLCEELLNSAIPVMSIADAIDSFTDPVASGFKGSYDAREIPSENVIGCLRKASIRLPDSHHVSVVLANSQFVRFCRTSYDDYNEGIAILDKLISFRDPGGRLSPYPVRHLCHSSIRLVWEAGVSRAGHLPQSYLS
jgi:hypothetical protein